MANNTNALPSTTSGRITCHYTNKTSKLQVIRISNIEGWYFERVIFAGQPLILDVDSEAILEVHTYEMATAILADRIPCRQLRYAEPIAFPQTPRNGTGETGELAGERPSEMAIAS